MTSAVPAVELRPIRRISVAEKVERWAAEMRASGGDLHDSEFAVAHPPDDDERLIKTFMRCCLSDGQSLSRLPVSF
jgi:hypothetical protein